MHRSRTPFWLALLLMIALVVAPAGRVSADDATGEEAHDTEVVEVEPIAVATDGDGGAATGFTLSLLGLILGLVAVVGVIGAVGLGVIGVGYWTVSGDGDG